MSIRCWCGVRNPYYSDDPYGQGCYGTGSLDCLCGGDFCICHHHGEVSCDGCTDCRFDGLDDDDMGDQDDALSGEVLAR